MLYSQVTGLITSNKKKIGKGKEADKDLKKELLTWNRGNLGL